MTPQSAFMVMAEIVPERRGELEGLLASMTSRSCLADPANAIVPFGAFDRLHVARFAILDLDLRGDLGVYGEPPRPYAPHLAFLGDCDGPADAMLDELAARAGDGLRRIFAHCRHFGPRTDLRRWLDLHSVTASAVYVNWRGRTVARIREDARLRTALVAYARTLEPDALPPARLRDRLFAYVDAERTAGRLTLTPEAPTPAAARLAILGHLVALPLVLLLLAPLLLVASPVMIYLLRSRETSDPELAPRLPLTRIKQLSAQEDHEFTNQFSAIGDLKPGRFRRLAVMAFLALLHWGARHLYGRGYLTRVQTIHFARWVLIDDARSLYFASNYDGSLDSYMDDFINKVAWGINLVFGNGLGFPRVSWLLRGGAKFEGKYKRYLRRHQIPTQVWYKAYPDLSVADLNRNSRIRAGVDRRALGERETLAWLALL
ncbi:MAG: hypothetical protein U1E52_15820 [Geminicoccaceae bacterium]